jgi:hypothetical protein
LAICDVNCNTALFWFLALDTLFAFLKKHLN